MSFGTLCKDNKQINKPSMKYAVWLFLFSWISISPVFAQFNITFPTERAIFQRDNLNQGNIFIAGNYQIPVSVVQARLTSIQGGTSTDWTPVVMNPSGGNFSTQLPGRAGWYTLDIRALHNGIVVAETRISRVGIGEVIVISGQSNARGILGDTFHPQSTDDRVNCITNFFANDISTPPFPTFGRLQDGNTLYAPEGYGSWMWGALGDKIAAQEQVPVLIINTGWEGLAIDSWTESAQNRQATNPFSGFRTKVGYPYNSLRYSLNYYANLLGIRSVLWVQGESDNFIRKETIAYQFELENIIRATREHTGRNIPWVIARASYFNGTAYEPVVSAQTRVGTTYLNTFLGPNLDLILDRYDRTHFNTLGLLKAADAWMEFLTPTFFRNAQATLGLGFVQPSLFCTSDSPTPMRVSIPGSFVGVRWNTGQTSQEIFTSSGLFQAELRDTFGNVRYSPNLFFGPDLVPIRPTILVEGAQSICDGETTTLRANPSNGIIWNTGQTTPSILVRQSTTAQVTVVNTYGCINRSNPVSIQVNPVPKPEINLVGENVICSDQTTQLVSNISSGIRWSNGVTTPALTINQTGSFSLTATNEFGCTATTNPVSVFVGQRPNQPTIERVSPFTLVANVTIGGNTGIEWNTGGQLIAGERNTNLRMTQVGSYTARMVSTYQALGKTLTCASPVSSEITLTQDEFNRQIVLFPNPVITSSFKTELKEIEENVTVQIFTTLGQLVRSYDVPRFDEVKTFSVVGLPKGTYFVEFKNRYIHETKRILID